MVIPDLSFIICAVCRICLSEDQYGMYLQYTWHIQSDGSIQYTLLKINKFKNFYLIAEQTYFTGLTVYFSGWRLLFPVDRLFCCSFVSDVPRLL